MTHSLHREGDTAAEKDFVWFMYQTKDKNDDNIPEKAKEFVAVVEKVGSANWGDVKTGPTVSHSKEEIMANIKKSSRLRGVFTDKEKVVEFLKGIKEKEIGLSVVVAGYLDVILDACKEADVQPHTINFKVGVFGNKDRLPEKTTLELTTMCGHHMVPDKFVERKRKEVKEGKISAKDAAVELATFCPCGIFNQVRAEEILKLEKQAQ